MVAPAENVAQLCRELDVTVQQYRGELEDKAKADSSYKWARAKRILRAQADGEAKSVAQAETIADADDGIADLRLKYLITDGIATATKEHIASLKERINFGRSLMATERAADTFHAQRSDVP